MNSITTGIAEFGAGLFQSLGVGSHKTTAFAAAFDQSPHGGLLVERASLRIIGANQTMLRQLEIPEESLRALTLDALFDYDCQPEILLARLRGPNPKTPMRAIHKRKDGREIEMELVGFPVATTRGEFLVYTAQDVSLKNRLEVHLRKKQEHLDQLAHLANHDQLTGLANRTFLAARMPLALVSADRKGRVVALLLVDIDRFKHLNDVHGYDTGDQLLIAIGKRLRAAARDNDIVARIGGDEFVVVLNDLTSEQQCCEAATRLVESLSGPFEIGGRSIVTSASVGASVFPRDGADMEVLLRHADEAMNQAKECGRGTWQIYGAEMDRRLKRRINIEAHLREAINTAQLDVYYHPIVDIQTRRVTALESLLRWHHPTYGLVPTESFIATAEQTGLIVPIGDFVFDRVLQDIGRWQADGCTLVPVAVNVSAAQLQRSNLAELIRTRAKALKLKPSMLQIELGQDIAFDRRGSRAGDPESEALAQLRGLGVHIAIDDFGTGTSSLVHLKQRQVDSLKIDRSFVRDMDNDSGNMAVVVALTAIARHLGVPAVAVGVESWQQLEKLRDLGCTHAQGHLFARPVPADRCPVYLSSEPIDFVARNEENATNEATGVNPSLLFEELDQR